MESAFVAVIALLALLGGAAALLSRQRMLPWSAPALRIAGRPVAKASENGSVPVDNPESKPDAIAEPTPVTSLVAARSSHAERTRMRDEPFEPGEPVRLEIVPAANEAIAARLDRIEERLEVLHRAIMKQSEELAETRRLGSELMLWAEAGEARRDAAQERLRADVFSAISQAAMVRQPAAEARRPQVSAELYARLARLEAALATVTNPVLLPGETYAPPAEFLPEALIWEHWNEVGERAFALADTFSAQRLHLSEQTRADFGEFVTTLRTLLTRAVYPNLQPESDLTQQEALRAALEEIAAELPKARATLELEYRDKRSD